MQIAIIGGGIGGLTTALALRQAGFEPQVFEQAPRLLEVGAAIIMWPNAMRVLHRLGVADSICRHGDVIEQTRWLNHDGKLLNQVRLPKSDTLTIALHRADLQHELLTALPQDSIHLGHVFTAFEQLPDRIVAHFHERPSFEGEVLIGADGLHSRARAQLLNDGPPTDRGYLAWRGVVANPPASLAPATAIEIYGRGKRFGIGPIGRGRVGWWATSNKTDHPSMGPKPQPASAEASQSGLTKQQELLRLFDGWCEPVVELIQATPLSSLLSDSVCDRRAVKKWSTGSMALLGDAVHPTTPNLGQGGCLAIEDAALLARCLQKYALDAGRDERGKANAPSPVAVALRKF